MSETGLRLAVVIPAHNEAARIAATVRAALRIEGVERVVVVDDASTDATSWLASDAGGEVVRLDRQAGKGAALEAGLRSIGEALPLKTVEANGDGEGPTDEVVAAPSPSPATFDAVLLLDGDLGETAEEGKVLARAVAAGADMAVGVLPPARRAGFGAVIMLARWGIRRYGGPFDASAPLSGQRALDGAAIAAVRPLSGGFGAEVTQTIRCLRAGLRVEEVPVGMSHSATGRDLPGFLHRSRQFLDVARALWMLRTETRPRHSTSRG